MYSMTNSQGLQVEDGGTYQHIWTGPDLKVNRVDLIRLFTQFYRSIAHLGSAASYLDSGLEIPPEFGRSANI